MDREKLKQELLRDEGLRLSAYTDSLGYWTIGVGHYLGTTKRMVTITRAEADALLEADIAEAERLAGKYAPNVFNGLFPFAKKETQQRALVNMAFNLGSRLGQFKKFLAATNDLAWETAADEMMNSKWAKQVGKRAERLRDMIRGAE